MNPTSEFGVSDKGKHEFCSVAQAQTLMNASLVSPQPVICNLWMHAALMTRRLRQEEMPMAILVSILLYRHGCHTEAHSWHPSCSSPSPLPSANWLTAS